MRAKKDTQPFQLQLITDVDAVMCKSSCVFGTLCRFPIFGRFLDVRFSKRYFLKIELIQDIGIAHRQFRLVSRS